MSCEAFPHSGVSVVASSCSDGGANEHTALYLKLWTRLQLAWSRPSSLLFHRPSDEPAPLGSLLRKMQGGLADESQAAGPVGNLPAIGQWLGAAHHWSPEAAGGGNVDEEPPLPLRDSEPLAPWSQSLLGKVWGKVWLGVLEPRSWYDLARRAACYPRDPNKQALDRWTRDYPASSLHQEKPDLSIWPHADLPLSAVQRMEKSSELYRPIAVDQDHGYFSLEEEQTNPQQLNSDNDICPRPEGAMDHSSEANDGTHKKDTYAANEDEVLLHLVDVDLATCNHLDIENKVISLGDDEWDSSDDTEGDSAEEEISLSLARPQCSNKTIAYILGSPDSDDEDDSEDDSDWDSDGFDSDESSELSDSSVDLQNPFPESSDPYNLLNFKASIKTQHKLETRTSFEPSHPQQSLPCLPIIEDLEDRLDSGFSEIIQDESHVELPLQRKCCKRVTFDEHVTEYYVSSEEIRKGPWEEYARDRCRFQKRIKETEESIGYCFTLKHRWTVLKRLQMES
ncbi:uncharacterized protein ppp1r15b [Mobula birostris]|uniref:uncharacterized protein ppp1r15b n=1 Tax=Mobula birostris TaxID=1983395 RepID=UPI003B28D7E8